MHAERLSRKGRTKMAKASPKKMTLLEFIEHHHGDKTNGRRGKFTISWFARECGVSYPYMYGLVKGKHPMTASMRQKLRALTDGQISMDSL